MTINRQWIFASRPQGMVGPANFEYRETPLSDAPLQAGDVLVRNKTFSLIPAQRTWMNADSEYFPPYKTDVRSGFKNLPTVFGELFTGGNDGTLILTVD